MKTAIIIILLVIILLSFIISTYIILYNKIKFSKTRIDQAEKVINDELEIRYKLINKCKKTIEKNTKMDLNIFSELERIKSTNISSIDFEKKITEAITTIYLVQKDYPKLEEKKEFKNLLRSLNESDTKITAAKSFYNKNNKELIALIRKFPSNIIALINGIKIQPYYDTTEVFEDDL